MREKTNLYRLTEKIMKKKGLTLTYKHYHIYKNSRKHEMTCSVRNNGNQLLR